MDHDEIRKDILYAMGIENKDDSSSTSEDSDDNGTERSSDSEDKKTMVVKFNGQRMYGRNPAHYKRQKHRR